MSTIPREAIAATLLSYLQTNLSEDVDQGRPTIFDPNKPSVTDWFSVEINSVRSLPSKDNCPRAEIILRVTASSKSQTDLYKPEELLDSVSVLLPSGSTLDVVDYSDSSQPQVGYIRIKEDNTRPVARSAWKEITMDIEARYYGVV